MDSARPAENRPRTTGASWVRSSRAGCARGGPEELEVVGLAMAGLMAPGSETKSDHPVRSRLPPC